MALESTNIKDTEGAALYILHTGNILEGRELQHLVDEIAQQTKRDIQMLDINTQDGEKVRDFYDIDISDLPAILIVRDDDTLTNMWTHSQLPTANVIIHALREVSGD